MQSSQIKPLRKHNAQWFSLKCIQHSYDVGVNHVSWSNPIFNFDSSFFSKVTITETNVRENNGETFYFCRNFDTLSFEGIVQWRYSFIINCRCCDVKSDQSNFDCVQLPSTSSARSHQLAVASNLNEHFSLTFFQYNLMIYHITQEIFPFMLSSHSKHDLTFVNSCYSFYGFCLMRT